MRFLRVFRDISSLSPEAGLWTSIERGLERSSWFVLLMSPSRLSPVGSSSRSNGGSSIARSTGCCWKSTSGHIAWDQAIDDFNRERSQSLRYAFVGRFSEEPSWVDARGSTTHAARSRLQETVADVASTLKQIPKDELFAGGRRRDRRQSMRLARTG